MTFLQLPLLKPTDTILLALDYMQKANARAIVVGPGQGKDGAYVLQMNTAVMKGYQKKRQFLSQLEPGMPLPDMSRPPAFQGLKRVLDYSGPEKAVEDALDIRNTAYAFGAAENTGLPLATVVTRHETYAGQIQSADKVCVCDGPSHHSDKTPPPAHDGDNCKDCGHKYICR